MTPEQAEFCNTHGLTEEQFFGKEEIKGDLKIGTLRSLTVIPADFKPVVEGDLSIVGYGKDVIIKERFSPKVGGDLFVFAETIFDNFSPVVGKNCVMSSTIGGLKSIPKGFNPKVGFILDLRFVKNLPNGFCPDAYVVFLSRKTFKFLLPKNFKSEFEHDKDKSGRYRAYFEFISKSRTKPPGFKEIYGFD
jgi:hypothetical protein